MRGIVKNKSTGEPVIGAMVLVEGTPFGVTTDKLGWFEIKDVSSGRYNLVVTALDFEVKRVFVLSVSLAQEVEKIAFQNFSLSDFSGARYDFEKVVKSSKVTILSFWASWCEPCLKELVELKDVYEKYYTDGLRIVTINIDSRYDLMKAKRFTLQNKLKYIMLYDGSGEVKKKYKVESLPQMFIFDSNGNLKGHFRGFKDIKIIENKINELLYGGEK